MANATLTGETCKLKPECSTVLKTETALSARKGWGEGEHNKLLMEQQASNHFYHKHCAVRGVQQHTLKGRSTAQVMTILA